MSRGATVVLDSSIIITLCGGKCTEHQQEGCPECIARANYLINKHEILGDDICLTAPGFAEIFSYMENSDFEILDMNGRASAIAHEITVRELQYRRAQPADDRPVRKILKADLQILATALAHNAAVLYSTDGYFEKVVRRYRLDIKAGGLPEIPPEQLSLFMEEEFAEE